MANIIYSGDSLELLAKTATGSIDLIYIDPPFNTGKEQLRKLIKTSAAAEGFDRIGFTGKTYKTETISELRWNDDYSDFLKFLGARLTEAWRVLKPNGTLIVHLDYREAHYVKVMMDGLFGRDKFLNEIIWAWDYGGKSKSKWPAKHNTILVYVKDPDDYTFNLDEVDRIPYMAPGMVTAEKATLGKVPTDVWWHTIVPTNGKEKTGYPTQKPLGIMERIVKVHSNKGDTVMDFFAGSGTTGMAAAKNERQFILADINPEAIKIIKDRLKDFI